MRVALYARVSTKQHGQDPETQLVPLREHGAYKHYQVTGEYVDLGWSGSKDKRPQLDRLMADARKRKFDVVLVARFDRFARSTRHLLSALEEFRSLQINFVSLNENIDTSTAMGKMVFTMVGAIAEFERELIRERVQAGVDRARKQGKRLGRPSVLVDRQRICDEVARGQSIAKVAKEAGISRSTVRSIIAKYAPLPEAGDKALLGGGEIPPGAPDVKR